jgi:hypothetical protein
MIPSALQAVPVCRNSKGLPSLTFAVIGYLTGDRGIIGHSEFLREIIRLCRYVTAQLSNPYFDQLAWLPSFPFTVPDYEPGSLQRWDPVGQRWALV